MATDQAQIRRANLNIAYSRIVAPITGRVGLRLVDPGNYLQPSDATGIVVITQIDPISVVFTTPEDNLPHIAARLNSGAKLQVTALDRANVNALATGTLTTFDNQIDITTGTFKLRATFANPNAVLFPNQFVNVRLLVDTLTGAALAPNAAVQLGASGNFVYVVKDDVDGHRTRHHDRPGRRQAHRDRHRPGGRRERGDRRRRPAARRREGQGRRRSGEPRGAGRGRRRARAKRRRTADGRHRRTASSGHRQGRPRQRSRSGRQAPPAGEAARARRRRSDAERAAGRRDARPGPAGRRRKARRNDAAALRGGAVNPSRLFIDRPVATSRC